MTNNDIERIDQNLSSLKENTLLFEIETKKMYETISNLYSTVNNLPDGIHYVFHIYHQIEFYNHLVERLKAIMYAMEEGFNNTLKISGVPPPEYSKNYDSLP